MALSIYAISVTMNPYLDASLSGLVCQVLFSTIPKVEDIDQDLGLEQVGPFSRRSEISVFLLIFVNDTPFFSAVLTLFACLPGVGLD
jgi:hypothetical protein